MRCWTYTVFCALVFAALPVQPAFAAASMIGAPCDYAGLGMTQLDKDNKNVIACLCDTPAHANCGSAHPEYLKWKSISNKSFNCPAGQALAGITNGEPQCKKIDSLNTTCPAGEAVTSIVDGVAKCTKQGVTPPGVGSCPAKATPINSCVVYTQEPRWGHLVPTSTSGGYVAPAGGSSYSSQWVCSEDDPYTTLMASVQYMGTAYCSGGTWYCVILRNFPMWSQHAGWTYSMFSPYYNGPC